MSVRLSLTPNWFLQISRTNESVSIGVLTTLFPLDGTYTLLNLKLVLLEYCSCSSNLFSKLLILCFSELIWSFWSLFRISWRINASLLCLMVSRWGFIHSSTVLTILGLMSCMTFSLICGIIESINSWFLTVAHTTSDRCRMVLLWTAVKSAWSVLTVLEVTFTDQGWTKSRTPRLFIEMLHRRRWIIRTTFGLIPFITSLGYLGYKSIKFRLFVFVYLVGHFEVYSTRQKYIIYVREKVTSHS